MQPDVKIKAVKDKKGSVQIEIWVDKNEGRSCGESRSNWEKITTVPRAAFLRQVLDVANNLTEVTY